MDEEQRKATLVLLKATRIVLDDRMLDDLSRWLNEQEDLRRRLAELDAASLFWRFVRARKVPRCPSWPRFWEPLRYCLPKKPRQQIYEPAHNELLEDYLESRKYRTKWARRWLNVCFTLRTFLLIVDCWREVFKNELAGLLPEQIREWWAVRPRP